MSVQIPLYPSSTMQVEEHWTLAIAGSRCPIVDSAAHWSRRSGNFHVLATCEGDGGLTKKLHRLSQLLACLVRGRDGVRGANAFEQSRDNLCFGMHDAAAGQHDLAPVDARARLLFGQKAIVRTDLWLVYCRHQSVPV